jgi:Domain of unknown function (DUF5069)
MSADKGKLNLYPKDLTTDLPRSPHETIAGHVLAARALDRCRAELNGTQGEYHFNCPLDNMFFSFAGISGDEFKDFVATGASDDEVAAWIAQHAQPRRRIEVIRWNNDLRYRQISELPDGLQEFLEDYIPQFVPANLRPHIDYFFDVYDAEEKRLKA